MNLSDILNSINYDKKNLYEENEYFAEKSYVPFVVNRCLSYFSDTILHANLMNTHSHLCKRMQYEYYLNALRKNKRFAKMLKNEMSHDMELVIQHFSVSRSKAKEMLPLLNPDFMEELRSNYLKNHENINTKK